MSPIAVPGILGAIVRACYRVGEDRRSVKDLGITTGMERSEERAVDDRTYGDSSQKTIIDFVVQVQVGLCFFVQFR